MKPHIICEISMLVDDNQEFLDANELNDTFIFTPYNIKKNMKKQHKDNKKKISCFTLIFSLLFFFDKFARNHKKTIQCLLRTTRAVTII